MEEDALVSARGPQRGRGHVHSVTYRTLSGISVHSLSTRCVGSAEDIVSK